MLSYGSEQPADSRVVILNNDGTTVTGYHNGTSVGTVSGIANFTNATALDLGRQFAGPLHFDGYIYAAVTRDTALTSQEISDLNAYLTGLMS